MEHLLIPILDRSFLLQLGDLSNPELRILTDQLDKIRHGGEYKVTEHLYLILS
jgi:hypothetical protein